MSVNKSNEEFFYKVEQKTRVVIGEGSGVKRSSFLRRQQHVRILSQQRKGEINSAGERKEERRSHVLEWRRGLISNTQVEELALDRSSKSKKREESP